jgi:hypothetical protein
MSRVTGERGRPKPKKWTDFTIESLRPSAGRTEASRARLPGLCLAGRVRCSSVSLR